MQTNTRIANHFYNFHPISLMIYFILLLISFLSLEYSKYLIFIFAILSVQYMLLVGAKKFLKSFIYFILLTIFMGIFNLIFNHSGDTPFLYINGIPITIESFIYGIYSGIMISCFILLFNCFNKSVDNGKINYLFSRHLPVFGLIISMSFSIFERFKNKLDTIKLALFTQGIRSSLGLLSKIRYASTVFTVLISVLLEDSVDTALSMTARGYGSHTKKTYKKYSFKANDFIMIIAALFFTFMTIIGFIPFIYLITVLPIIYNIYSEVLWYYQSKI